MIHQSFLTLARADAHGQSFDDALLSKAVTAAGRAATRVGFGLIDANDATIRKSVRKHRREFEREMRREVYQSLGVPGALLRLAAWVLPVLFPQYAAAIKVAAWVIDWALNLFDSRPAALANLMRSGGVA